MKQLRLNFSDYSAEEQEYDSQRIIKKVPKHVYLLKVDGEWCSFIVKKDDDDDIKYFEDRKLPVVYKWLKKHRPEYTVRVIQNKGLEEYLRCRRDDFKPKYKQLYIKGFER
jgi:hypothetical protein